MSPDSVPTATLTTVANFPLNYFLENLVVRSDNSLLVSVATKKELWYVPPVDKEVPVDPLLLCKFDQIATGIVEAEPDVFYLCTSEVYTTHESYLHKLDLRGWTPGSPVHRQTILKFPGSARGLNGACLIAPNVLLVADMFASLIWRVDISPKTNVATARVWLSHQSMAHIQWPETKPPQPGVNGVRFASKSNYLYYTSTAQLLFMRVRVDPDTQEPDDEPEFVAGGRMADDFCIDEDAGVAYLATHRQNTIDRVALDPAGNRGFLRNSVAGDPFTDQLIGPSSGAWGKGPGEYGRCAYFLTDGGTTSPPPTGIVLPAKVLRVEMY